jgi:UDP-N-acetylmuramate dehydrogenase
MQLYSDYSLLTHNTFGINVKAKFFIKVSSVIDIVEALNDSRCTKENKFILGGGSNILFTKNYDGLVLQNLIEGISVEDLDGDNIIVTTGAGVNWHSLVEYCVENNFGGIENLSLIPGTVGAAPIQNIGAYGQELKNVFFSLKGILVDTGEEIAFLKNDCKFGYRNSIFKNEFKNKIVITSVSLKLNKKPELVLDYGNVKNELEKLKLTRITIKDVSNVICRIRESKLPDPKVFGNAGSFFKNPEIDSSLFDEIKKDYAEAPGYETGNKKIKIPAGWLIEKAGWKGKRIGNVGTYQNQALVIVNYSNASGEEVISFADKIKESVYDKFKIWLEAEVNII